MHPVFLQDAEGKTPIHFAIENQHPVIISLLLSHPNLNLKLKDRSGNTPFAAAMMTRNNKAAQAILDREPTAAEQVGIIFRQHVASLRMRHADAESLDLLAACCCSDVSSVLCTNFSSKTSHSGVSQ